jgi:hypothetical protein
MISLFSDFSVAGNRLSPHLKEAFQEPSTFSVKYSA